MANVVPYNGKNTIPNPNDDNFCGPPLPSSSGITMIPSKKQTENYDFGLSYSPKLDGNAVDALNGVKEQKYGDIVDINNKMESEIDSSSNTSSGFVMIETENEEQKKEEFSFPSDIYTPILDNDVKIVNGIDNLDDDYYIGLNNNNILINTFHSTIEQLEKEKNDLDDKHYNFTHNLEYNPDLYYDFHKGCLPPNELTSENASDWLSKNGYPASDWTEPGSIGMQAFYKYVNDVYTPLYNKYYEEYVGMTYDEYISRRTKINEDLIMLRAASYSLEQQMKQWTYINIMENAMYQAYADEFDTNVHMHIPYLNNDELVMYYYLSERKGETYAKNYLTAIEDTINQRKGKKEADEFIKSISGSDGKIDRNLWTGAKTAGKGLLDGIDTFGEGLSNLFATEGVISSNQYAQMYILEALGSQGIMDDTYLVSSSIGNMLPSMGVSALLSIIATPTVGSVVGNSLMGISSAGNAKNQALISGNGQLASTFYGLSVGLSETTLGLLMGNIPFLNANAKFGIKAIIGEGLEEFTQTFVEAGLRSTILGESVDISKLMGEAGQSFIYGVITSGLTTGGALALNITMNGKKANIESVNDLFSMLHILNRGDVSISKINGKDVIVLGSDADANSDIVKTIKQIFPNIEIQQIVSSDGETVTIQTDNNKNLTPDNIFNSFKQIGSKISDTLKNTFNKLFFNSNKLTSLSTTELIALLNDCYNNNDITYLSEITNRITETQLNDLLTYFKTNPSNLYNIVINNLSPEQFMNALNNNLVQFQNGYISDMNISTGNDKFIPMSELLKLMFNDALRNGFVTHATKRQNYFTNCTNEEIIYAVKLLSNEFNFMCYTNLVDMCNYIINSENTEIIDGITYNLNVLSKDVSNYVSIERVSNLLKRVPPALRKYVSKVNIFDINNPADSFWEKEYGIEDFVSGATGGEGIINFYHSCSHISDESLLIVIYHEIAHSVDKNYEISLSNDWMNAVKADKNKPTPYCNAAIWEDFAESVAYYFSDPKFAKKFPNRAKFITKLFFKR